MPSTINQPLGSENEQRIKKNWTFLKTELQQEDIRDKFMDEAIWDVPDFEEIDAGNVPQKQNEIFLKLLLRSGPRAYKVFLDALREKQSDHIIEKLESTQISESDQAGGVDHLAELSDEQKSHILTEQNLLKFNKVVGSDIEILGKVLGLVQADIDVARMENTHSAATQIHKVILKWKHRNGKNASLGTFTRLLMDAEDAGARVDWDKFYEGVKGIRC